MPLIVYWRKRSIGSTGLGAVPLVGQARVDDALAQVAGELDGQRLVAVEPVVGLLVLRGEPLELPVGGGRDDHRAAGRDVVARVARGVQATGAPLVDGLGRVEHADPADLARAVGDAVLHR